ncbi:putative glycoside hydrolase family 78 protein [Rosellinia necatrix]|uniref:Putative glycoside hydrolase family 78 protein n=1 Tax=Rosellinia necatrix TaxID=77044 RepID=A0A1W2THV1_ROSNE|nr:putative glycoside hydrolase family 78 protein [Rosellinia necatrix]
MHKHLVVSVIWPAVLMLCPPVIAQDPPSWQKYVRSPESAIVRPAAILPSYTRGDIENPDGLVTGASTTLFTGAHDSGETPALVVDFGQNVVGQLLLEFAGSTNGSSGGFPGIRLTFSEALEYLADTSDYTRSDRASGDPPKLVTTGTDQVAVKNGPYTWEDQWGCEYGSKVCADGLHAFRYVRISLDALGADAPYTSAQGQVQISSVGLRWSGYLGTPDTFTGWFECSDANLTQWWYDGVYTVDMGTDVFRANDTEPRGATSASLLGKLVLHDGAKRDRDPYMGDLAVASLTSYLSHANAEATRNVLEDLAAHQRADGWLPPASINHYELPLFDYPLYWITCSWDYVLYTGNTSYVDAHYAVMARVLDAYYPAHTDNATQLLVRQDGYGDFAFLPRPGSAAYYNALYVLALNKAADLAGLSSPSSSSSPSARADDAARWRERAAAVSSGFQSTLWDAAASAYLDRKCAGAGCGAHAQDGNSLAVLAGIADDASAASALRYLAEHNARPYGNAFYDAGGEELGAGFSDRVYAFVSYFEAAARFETRDPAGALDLIRRTWGWMAAADPGVTHWEGIGAGGAKYEGPVTSLAHGWSTGVTPLLTTYVLGVRPTAPGFREWAVDPVPGDGDDISWARGVAATPYGPLGVSWDRDADGNLRVVVDAPEGTTGTVGSSGGTRVEGGKTTTVVVPVAKR